MCLEMQGQLKPGDAMPAFLRRPPKVAKVPNERRKKIEWVCALKQRAETSPILSYNPCEESSSVGLLIFKIPRISREQVSQNSVVRIEPDMLRDSSRRLHGCALSLRFASQSSMPCATRMSTNVCCRRTAKVLRFGTGLLCSTV